MTEYLFAGEKKNNIFLKSHFKVCTNAVAWVGCNLNWTLLANWAAAQALLSSSVFVSDVIVDWPPAHLKRWSITLLHNRLKRWTGSTPVLQRCRLWQSGFSGMEFRIQTGWKTGKFSLWKAHWERNPSSQRFRPDPALSFSTAASCSSATLTCARLIWNTHTHTHARVCCACRAVLGFA